MNQLTLTQTDTLTDASLAGGILGGMLATYGILVLVIYILLIVAWWKLFTKAGEKGWKSLIPIYNIYVFARIIGINFWIYYLGIPIALSILTYFVPALGILTGIYSIFLAIYQAIKLGDAFKKGTGFKVGLVLLSVIFFLILAFGKDKYVKPKASK